ncbi:MAG: Hint domain-containing protein [Rhodobacteraceae bacterium]|nr:Hint domain-containing protein [Paracoccaceae bacterium]
MMMKLGQMLRKEPVYDAGGRSGVWDGTFHGGHVGLTSGLIAGMQVATSIGWRDVAALQEGDKVLTFDEGMQPVRRITKRWTYTDQGRTPASLWPLHVPAGALGNRSAMTLLPEQPVMVESDAGEAMFGDPFTLIPALALEGYKGIEREHVRKPIEVVILHFDTEQVVFGNIGALFHCPAEEAVTIAGLMEDRYVPGYEVLSLTQARMFVDALIDEDAQDYAWMQEERRQRGREARHYAS